MYYFRERNDLKYCTIPAAILPAATPPDVKPASQGTEATAPARTALPPATPAVTERVRCFTFMNGLISVKLLLNSNDSDYWV